jgi:hypothetical protein
MSMRRLITIGLHVRGSTGTWTPVLGSGGDPVTACVSQGDLEAMRACLYPGYEWLEIELPRRMRR